VAWLPGASFTVPDRTKVPRSRRSEHGDVGAFPSRCPSRRRGAHCEGRAHVQCGRRCAAQTRPNLFCCRSISGPARRHDERLPTTVSGATRTQSSNAVRFPVEIPERKGIRHASGSRGREGDVNRVLARFGGSSRAKLRPRSSVIATPCADVFSAPFWSDYSRRCSRAPGSYRCGRMPCMRSNARWRACAHRVPTCALRQSSARPRRPRRRSRQAYPIPFVEVDDASPPFLTSAPPTLANRARVQVRPRRGWSTPAFTPLLDGDTIILFGLSG